MHGLPVVFILELLKLGLILGQLLLFDHQIARVVCVLCRYLFLLFNELLELLALRVESIVKYVKPFLHSFVFLLEVVELLPLVVDLTVTDRLLVIDLLQFLLVLGFQSAELLGAIGDIFLCLLDTLLNLGKLRFFVLDFAQVHSLEVVVRQQRVAVVTHSELVFVELAETPLRPTARVTHGHATPFTVV